MLTVAVHTLNRRIDMQFAVVSNRSRPSWMPDITKASISVRIRHSTRGDRAHFGI